MSSSGTKRKGSVFDTPSDKEGMQPLVHPSVSWFELLYENNKEILIPDESKFGHAIDYSEMEDMVSIYGVPEGTRKIRRISFTEFTETSFRMTHELVNRNRPVVIYLADNWTSSPAVWMTLFLWPLLRKIAISIASENYPYYPETGDYDVITITGYAYTSDIVEKYVPRLTTPRDILVFIPYLIEGEDKGKTDSDDDDDDEEDEYSLSEDESSREAPWPSYIKRMKNTRTLDELSYTAESGESLYFYFFDFWDEDGMFEALKNITGFDLFENSDMDFLEDFEGYSLPWIDIQKDNEYEPIDILKQLQPPALSVPRLQKQMA